MEGTLSNRPSPLHTLVRHPYLVLAFCCLLVHAVSCVTGADPCRRRCCCWPPASRPAAFFCTAEAEPSQSAAPPWPAALVRGGGDSRMDGSLRPFRFPGAVSAHRRLPRPAGRRPLDDLYAAPDRLPRPPADDGGGIPAAGRLHPVHHCPYPAARYGGPSITSTDTRDISGICTTTAICRILIP